MRSAAVPWRGVLTAVRSAKPRWLGLRDLNVGDGADAAEVGADGAGAADFFEGGGDELLDAGVALEVAVDVLAGGFLVDAELGGEAEGGDAVDDAEVDGFGAGAGFLVHRFRVDLEDFGGGEGVDVLAGGVGVEEEGVGGEVGHEAEFDLGVVGRHEDVAGGAGEGGADFAAGGGADGDVLEVGVGGGEAAGGGADLVEGGVDAVVAVGELGEGVEVGGFEFLELAVFEDEGGDFVEGGEVFEDVLGGGDDFALAVLHGLGEVHFVEEDVA